MLSNYKQALGGGAGATKAGMNWFLDTSDHCISSVVMDW